MYSKVKEIEKNTYIHNLCAYYFFFQDFESIVEVKNLETKETYMIHEKVKRDSVWLQMNKSSDKKLRTCTYSKLSGFGHTIYGIIILTYYLIKIVSSILWIICYGQTFLYIKSTKSSYI